MDIDYKKTAPQLEFSCDKTKYFGKIRCIYSQDIMDKINHKFQGASAQMSLMYVLMGTKGGFALANKWLQDRTGVSRANLYRTINELEKKGFVSRVDNGEKIVVNLEKLME